MSLAFSVAAQKGWALQLNGPSADYGEATAADHSGGVYTVGDFTSTALTCYDAQNVGKYSLTLSGVQSGYVAKYTALNGSFLWASKIVPSSG